MNLPTGMLPVVCSHYSGDSAQTHRESDRVREASISFRERKDEDVTASVRYTIASQVALHTLDASPSSARDARVYFNVEGGTLPFLFESPFS